MLPQLSIAPTDFQRQLYIFANNANSDLAQRLRAEFIGLQFDPEKPLLEDAYLKEWILKQPNAVVSFIIIANLCGHSRLPHIQWMFVNYADQLQPSCAEILSLINESRESFLQTFPFARDLTAHLATLEALFDCPASEKIAPIHEPKSADLLIAKARSKHLNQYALALAIKATRKFGPKFLGSITFILLDLRKVNEALKALLVLTFSAPLSYDQFVLWGKVSIELTSTRNYWAAKLGHLLFPSDTAILLNLSGSVAGPGAYREARAALEQVLNINPNNHSALINYANLVASEGRPAHAVKLLERAQRLEPVYSGRIDSNLLLLSQYDYEVN